MTMAEVLESIRGLGERFDRHAKRLQALERETGMEPDPDDDDSDEAKKAEEAMADDDDPDKDRGRSTRTPGQTMTRVQMHRAAREKEKLARSGKYGNIGINPNPGPSRNRDGDAGMNAGNMLRSALTSGSFRAGHRELEYLSSRAPIGYLAVSEQPVAINQGFIGMPPRDAPSNWYMMLWCKASYEEIISRANGSTFLEINRTNFRRIPMLLPETELLMEFDNLVRDLYRRISRNQRESLALAAQRDELLTKLVSGELQPDGTEE